MCYRFSLWKWPQLSKLHWTKNNHSIHHHTLAVRANRIMQIPFIFRNTAPPHLLTSSIINQAFHKGYKGSYPKIFTICHYKMKWNQKTQGEKMINFLVLIVAWHSVFLPWRTGCNVFERQKEWGRSPFKGKDEGFSVIVPMKVNRIHKCCTLQCGIMSKLFCKWWWLRTRDFEIHSFYNLC